MLGLTDTNSSCSYIFLDLSISADLLSREEALELFFSLPDESETSEDEAESSEDEFVPELAPPDSSLDEDKINLDHRKRNKTKNADKDLQKAGKEPTRK